MADEIEVKSYICSNCGEMTDYPMSKTVGCSGCSMAVCLIVIGIILLLFNGWLISIVLFIIAFFIQFIHHDNEITNICPHCEANNALIPTDSPKGEEILNRYYSNVEDIQE